MIPSVDCPEHYPFASRRTGQAATKLHETSKRLPSKPIRMHTFGPVSRPSQSISVAPALIDTMNATGDQTGCCEACLGFDLTVLNSFSGVFAFKFVGGVDIP
jgi:hypothetical protein